MNSVAFVLLLSAASPWHTTHLQPFAAYFWLLGFGEAFISATAPTGAGGPLPHAAIYLKKNRAFGTIMYGGQLSLAV